jgi:nucleoside-diphosphate-sugar epimerase
VAPGYGYESGTKRRVRQQDSSTSNLAIALNVIRASHAAGVKKLLFLGSSCIYPKGAAVDGRRHAFDRATR